MVLVVHKRQSIAWIDDSCYHCLVNTLRSRQDGRHFVDDILKWIFLKENCFILIQISLKYVPNGLINNNPALVQIMALRWQGDKPLSEQMMARLPTHICVSRPHWVNCVTSVRYVYRMHQSSYQQHSGATPKLVLSLCSLDHYTWLSSLMHTICAEKQSTIKSPNIKSPHNALQYNTTNSTVTNKM